MNSLIMTLLRISLSMSVPAILLQIFSALFGRYYKPRALYYAWLIITLGFLCPVRPSIGIPAVHSTEIAGYATAIGDGVRTFFYESAQPAILTQMSGTEAIFWVWLAGAVLSLGYHLLRHYRFVRFVKRWGRSVTDPGTLLLFQRAREEMNLSQPVALRTCPSIGGPMLLGYRNPVLLLPERHLPPEALALILRHELAHLRWRDLLVRLPVVLAVALHWFNPVIYLVARSLSQQCELSCDDLVVGREKAEVRKLYGETVLLLSRTALTQKIILSTNFGGGKQSMKHRILSILSMRRRKTGAAVVAFVLLASLGAGALTASTQALPALPEQKEAAPTYILPEDILTTEELRQTLEEGERFSARLIDTELWEKLGYLYEDGEAPPEETEELRALQDAQPVVRFDFQFANGEEIWFATPVLILEQHYRMDVTNQEHLDLFAAHFMRGRAERFGAEEGYSYTVSYCTQGEL